ncbi:MAG: hypothetical protein U0487_01785 [Patescibacteria group bacterium]
MDSQKPFAPYALYLLPSEKSLWDHLVTGVAVSLETLTNGARRLTQALLKAGLMTPDNEDSNQHRLREVRGIVVVEIQERRIYTLKTARYDLVRAIQSEFKPREDELRNESRERLDAFIAEWNEKNTGEEVKLDAWLMSSNIKNTPSQGSGLVTLIRGTGPVYLTIEGLEAFELRSSDKDGRVVSPRTTPSDRQRTTIPSRPPKEAFDEDTSLRQVIQHHEQSIERLKEQNRNDNGTIAELQKRIEDHKTKIAEREAEIAKREEKIDLLKKAAD